MKVLVFAPHAGVWVHAFPEALVADAVRAGGAELVYVTCDGALAAGCVTMAAQGVGAGSPPAARAAACAGCRAARDDLRAGFGLRGPDLDAALPPGDRAAIEAWIDATARPDSLLDLELDGVAVGRAALYEFLIQRKKLTYALTAEEWVAFRPRLVNAVRSLRAAQRVLERERPDRVVVYNSLYSVNAVWRAVADQRGIPFYFVHAGLSLHDRLSQVLVGRDSTLVWWNRIIAAWPRYRDQPCHPAELARVTDHFLQLFRGTSAFAYSAPKAAEAPDVRARFGVAPHQRLLVATMSSYDEYVAAAAIGGVPDQATLLFPTQIEWIQALIGHLRTRPDLFLLVRVHPREFPNKRDGVTSEHARALAAALAELPPNVRVNWPSDALSMYDVAEQADAILNAWSSAGKEMALLGLPVVTYCPAVLMYPADLNFIGTDLPGYLAAIDAALAAGWSFDRVRAAFRWCVLEYLRGLVDIGDAFRFPEDAPSTPLHRLGRLALAPPAVRRRWDLWRRPGRLAAGQRLARLVLDGHATLLDVPAFQRTVAPDRELAAIRREVGRLVEVLYGRAAGAPAPGTLRARLAAVATSAES